MTKNWLLLVGLLGSLFSAAPAAAEPRFSARTGLRCAHCHTSPLGGGKRTPYGALYAMSSLPLTHGRPPLQLPATRAKDGTWLVNILAVGEVTDWLGMGADVRLANTTTFAEEQKNSFDVTEANLYLELRPWIDRITLYLDEGVGAGGAQNREVWGMVHGPWSTYLRAGRLLPPFGLRILDDEAYTRRVSGVNFANADLGLELGLSRGPLFFALAVTNGTFTGSDPDPLKAFYGLVELNFSSFRVGWSGLHNPADAGCRSMTGLFAAAHLGRLVGQGEGILIADRPADQEQRTYQLTTYALIELLLTKGLSVQASWDYHDADLELGEDRRQRFRLGLDVVPFPLVELKLYYVIKQAETAEPLDRADLLEVVLHVML